MEQEKQRLALQTHEENKNAEVTEIEEHKDEQLPSVEQEHFTSEKDSQS
ncbi:hypothetical protein [Anaerotignum sp.]|nr:hypothetical protein [Anaerotignum sp.]